MEREELESEPGDVSKTRKPSRNKLACSIACLDGANFNINIEVGTKLLSSLFVFVDAIFLGYSQVLHQIKSRMLCTLSLISFTQFAWNRWC